MSRVQADEERITAELNEHWEVISEGAQTILRAVGRGDAYESIKAETRGKVFNEASYRGWVEALDVDSKTREQLLDLSPASYIGRAVEITDEVLGRK